MLERAVARENLTGVLIVNGFRLYKENEWWDLILPYLAAHATHKNHQRLFPGLLFQVTFTMKGESETHAIWFVMLVSVILASPPFESSSARPRR